jgi:hypothetical protein
MFLVPPPGIASPVQAHIILRKNVSILIKTKPKLDYFFNNPVDWKAYSEMDGILRFILLLLLARFELIQFHLPVVHHVNMLEIEMDNIEP